MNCSGGTPGPAGASSRVYQGDLRLLTRAAPARLGPHGHAQTDHSRVTVLARLDPRGRYRDRPVPDQSGPIELLVLRPELAQAGEQPFALGAIRVGVVWLADVDGCPAAVSGGGVVI